MAVPVADEPVEDRLHPRDGAPGADGLDFGEVRVAHVRDPRDNRIEHRPGVGVELLRRWESHAVGVVRVLAGALVDPGKTPVLVKAVPEPDRLLAVEDEVDDVVDRADDVPDVPADAVGDAAACIAELLDGEAVSRAERVLQYAPGDGGELRLEGGRIAHAGEVRDVRGLCHRSFTWGRMSRPAWGSWKRWSMTQL